MPNDTIVVEGVTLDPEFVLDVADPQQVLFIIASEEFQREHFLKRDMQRTVFRGLPDPEGSFEAFLENLARPDPFPLQARRRAWSESHHHGRE